MPLDCVTHASNTYVHTFVCVRWGKNISKERTDKAMLGVAHSEYEMMNDMCDMMINTCDMMINMMSDIFRPRAFMSPLRRAKPIPFQLQVPNHHHHHSFVNSHP